MDWLVKTIEAEIIPRLIASHPESATPAPGNGATPALADCGPAVVQPHEVAEFTAMALNNESAVCQNYIDSIRERGVPLQSIYLHLLAPAARRLDGMWVADECDFTQITIALWRMQQVMYDLSPSFRVDSEGVVGQRRKIMLMPVPGSQHTLGILMVAEFFRRAGWGVWGEPAATRDRLLDAIREERYDLAGISVGSEAQLAELNQFIQELRTCSKNKSLLVMVGGPLFTKHPEFAEQIGADATAPDAEHAIQKAESLVAMQQQELRSAKGSQRAS